MPTTATTTTTTPAATTQQPTHWLASPFHFGQLADSSKDDQLKRYTLIFQSLAALATIFVAMYALTQRD